MKLKIGTYTEEAGRRFTYCPSGYAADHKTVETKGGTYDVHLEFVGGYIFPMPYWLLIPIRVRCLGGAYYSGFGGNNFAKQEIPAGGDDGYCIQMYDYQIKGLIAAGKLTLDPRFLWLLSGNDGRGFDWLKDNATDVTVNPITLEKSYAPSFKKLASLYPDAVINPR